MNPTSADPKPTLSEVASRAGVGRSSAARALGSYGSVSEHTRRRVMRAASELGYETNELARSMTTGVTYTIGVIVADIANPFFAAVLRGITDRARTDGYDTILINTDESQKLEEAAVRLLVGKQVDGIIIAPSGGANSSSPHLAWAQSRGVPIVQIDRVVDAISSDAVVMNNRHAARDSTALLLEAGHTRVSLVWGPQLQEPVTSRETLIAAAAHELSSTRERLFGYLDAHDAAGVPVDVSLIMTNEQNQLSTSGFATRILSRNRPATAFVVTETDAALGLLEALRKLGLSYPKDVSIIGFDDTPWAKLLTPPLSMVRQPVYDLGERAARMLVERMSPRPDAGLTSTRLEHLEAQIIDRGSIAVPL